MTEPATHPKPDADRGAVVTLALRSLRAFLNDDCPTMAAGIAYYVLFSIFPLVLGLVVLLGAVIRTDVLQVRLVEAIGPYLPGSGALIRETVRDVVEGSGTMGVVAVASLFWSATALISAVRGALNRVWAVNEARPLWWLKVRELAAIAVVGVLLLASFVLTTLVQVLTALLPAGVAYALDLVAGGPVFLVVSGCVSLVFAFGVFAVAYKRLPNAAVRWREAMAGAVVAAVLFEGAKQGFIVYLDNFASFNVVYGPLSSVIVFLLWAYISSLVLLVGAEVASQSRWVME